MRAPFKCDPCSVIVLRRLAMRGGFHRWRGLISILGNLTPSVSVGIGSPMEEGCSLSGCGDTCGGQERGVARHDFSLFGSDLGVGGLKMIEHLSWSSLYLILSHQCVYAKSLMQCLSSRPST